ncbi:hypothetical protein ACFUCH_16505 [Streptomyces olivaceus]|uniref:hypothetical protein n=1 Tax=Streptomyces olivaceus TaxID=47716 RepID=UPI0018A86C4B|nr:hypothetical protein [Streptomyces olivaceus]MBF8171469.1 hypothetical protein [Streptomyces olivaceus]
MKKRVGPRSWLTAGVAASVLAGGSVVFGASPAAAAACGASLSVKTAGASAAWDVACDAGHIRVVGWVKDTDNDGQCARVRVEYADGHKWYSPQACPKGTKVSFGSPWSDTKSQIINAYLYEFDV